MEIPVIDHSLYLVATKGAHRIAQPVYDFDLALLAYRNLRGMPSIAADPFGWTWVIELKGLT
jgi:hypothetical protein